VDEKEIDDPAASKPEGWDDIPKQIHDTQASKPADWDTELDGEWEAPLIDNPEYKGEWKATRISNPAYKGEWVHPKIENPDYKDDETIGKFESNKYLGIEIWQVKAGTIFDNFLVTDDLATAKTWAQKTVKAQEGEKAAYQKDKDDKAKEAAEKKESSGGADGEAEVDIDELDSLLDEKLHSRGDDYEGEDEGEDDHDEDHDEL